MYVSVLEEQYVEERSVLKKVGVTVEERSDLEMVGMTVVDRL